MLEDKTDIRSVVDALDELEKLKLLLFDSDQYYLFQHIPKPFLIQEKPPQHGSETQNKNPDQTGDEEQPKDPELQKKQTTNEVLKSNKLLSNYERSKEDKMRKFVDSLENVIAKAREGELNIIDQRLLEILNIKVD